MTRDDPDAVLKQALPAAAGIVGGIMVGAAALALVVLGFFFLAAALIAGVLLAAVILIRLGWLQRRITKAQQARYLSTEHTVVDRERPPDPPFAARRVNSKRLPPCCFPP